MSRTYCPSCDAAVSVDKPRVGDMVTCRECDTKLEIISIQPFELDFPLEYSNEDEDDEWEDED